MTPVDYGAGYRGAGQAFRRIDRAERDGGEPGDRSVDAVFLPRLVDGELPFRSGRAKADPEEERRLLYVGITRARRYLFLTWPTEGRGQPSPFLDHWSLRRRRPPGGPRRPGGRSRWEEVAGSSTG